MSLSFRFLIQICRRLNVVPQLSLGSFPETTLYFARLRARHYKTVLLFQLKIVTLKRASLNTVVISDLTDCSQPIAASFCIEREPLHRPSLMRSSRPSFRLYKANRGRHTTLTVPLKPFLRCNTAQVLF